MSRSNLTRRLGKLEQSDVFAGPQQLMNRLQAALNGAALRTTGRLYCAVRHDGAMRERIFTDVHDRFFSKLSDAELDIVESEIKAGRSLV
jgi:hypothetical protein